MSSVTNSQYSFTAPRRQLFSVPYDVVSSMLNNPSSHKGLSKLYQTCKYFYAKRPILIADYVKFLSEEDENGDEVNTIKIFSKDFYQNVSHLKTLIWPVGTIEIYSDIENFFELPKLFRYSMETVFMFDVIMKFEDFVCLTSENTVTRFVEDIFYVFHPDWSEASLDQILQLLPNVRDLDIFIDKTCSAEIFTKMNDIKFNNKFERVLLHITCFHPTFDINLLCEFLMKNSTDNTHFRLYHNEELKEELKFALDKCDPIWINEASDRLKEEFCWIDPTWGKEEIKE